MASTTTTTTKQRALDDAHHANAAALALRLAASSPPPTYRLDELIGRGSFGRVYKATHVSTADVVAIKVIDIERGDAAAPGLADTLADLQRELAALHALRGSAHINHVVEALLVGPAVWLVVEYCAGGSVATLMRPLRASTAGGGGLREKWIVPILRETAAALSWVHERGIIHRDVKAANVLVAEDGRRHGVQLCDFGVAATLHRRDDKRTTVVGTPHYMAPEQLLSGSESAGGYGSEVDVWAFGALAYELATGRPPNASLGVCGLARLGRVLQTRTPRLSGGEHSDGVRDLVACCLQREPARRPSMAEVRRHGYLAGTEAQFPTESLAQLVRAFRIWEAQGGDRRSLFSERGAASGADTDDEDDDEDDFVQDWNFSTAVEVELPSVSDGETLSVAYGIDVDRQEPRQQRNAASRRQQQQQRRQRQPPPRHAAVKSPLEKAFDSNTLSNYDDYSRQYYAKFLPAPVQQALLHNGLSGPSADRESLIDLDLCLADNDSSSGDSCVELSAGTLRRPAAGFGWGNDEAQEDEVSREHDDPKHATQTWKFPAMFSQLVLENHGPSSPDWSEANSDTSHSRSESLDSLIDLDMSAIPPSDFARRCHVEMQLAQPPPLPFAPQPQVIMGEAEDEQIKQELHRLTASLADHLRYATMYLANLPIRPIPATASGASGNRA
ncbi:hypothetical protein ARSEF4850_001994 [Beauveria asiatica]